MMLATKQQVAEEKNLWNLGSNRQKPTAFWAYVTFYPKQEIKRI
jgi:hypothetical protein